MIAEVAADLIALSSDHCQNITWRLIRMPSVRKHLISAAAFFALLNGVGCQKAPPPPPPRSPMLGAWQYEKAGGMFNDAKATMQIVFHDSGAYEWHVQAHGSLTGTDFAADGRGTWTLDNGILTNRDAKGAIETYSLTAHMQNLLTLTVVQAGGSRPGEVQQWRRIGDAEVGNADSSSAIASPSGNVSGNSTASANPGTGTSLPASTSGPDKQKSLPTSGPEKHLGSKPQPVDSRMAHGKAVAETLYKDDASIHWPGTMSKARDHRYDQADEDDYDYYLRHTYIGAGKLDVINAGLASAEGGWGALQAIQGKSVRHRDWIRQQVEPLGRIEGSAPRAADSGDISSSHRSIVRSQIIGKWQGGRHVNLFREDGTFCLDPGTMDDGFTLGTWEIQDDTLIEHYKERAVPEVWHIVELTPSEMRFESNGKAYNLRRAQ